MQLGLCVQDGALAFRREAPLSLGGQTIPISVLSRGCLRSLLKCTEAQPQNSPSRRPVLEAGVSYRVPDPTHILTIYGRPGEVGLMVLLDVQ